MCVTAAPFAAAPVGNAWLKNLYVEAKLLHSRNLDDFFRRERDRAAKPDDLFAVDCMPAWPRLKILDSTQREDVNKRRAHLTTARCRPEHRLASAATGRAMHARLRSIPQQAPPDRRGHGRLVRGEVDPCRRDVPGWEARPTAGGVRPVDRAHASTSGQAQIRAQRNSAIELSQDWAEFEGLLQRLGPAWAELRSLLNELNRVLGR